MAISHPSEKSDSSSSGKKQATPEIKHCFHCDLPVPAGVNLEVTIDRENRPMCCHGCLAVAQALIAAGHEHYYSVRTEPANTAVELVPEVIRDIKAFDMDGVRSHYVKPWGEELSEANLMLEGVTCAACLWLIERHLNSVEGIATVKVNYAMHRASVTWDPGKLNFSDILLAVQEIGYRALPFDISQQQKFRSRERRSQLYRIGIAALFGMQVMMISIGLYVGAWTGIEAEFKDLFQWLSLGMAIPVIGYCALPFFRAALNNIKHRHIGMDVSVSLALIIAFGASAFATVTGQGEIYFDAVVMFVFLLLLSRYLESIAVQRSAESIERLAHALPLLATRLSDNCRDEALISATLLVPGDRVLIRPGETVPADGDIVMGESTLDESFLNGESRPAAKGVGDFILGGSINLDNPMQMIVQGTGADTVLFDIHRMVEKAQLDKPNFSRFADRVAGHFVSIVLIITFMVAIFWGYNNPDVWLEITLATLIVSCPCALSLATPTVFSASLGKLQNMGLLVRRTSAIENLPRVSHIVFDKTGTLTQGRPVLVEVKCFDEIDRSSCFRIASSLERQSEHPLAKALIRASGDQISELASNVRNYPGAGIGGMVDNQQFFVGNIKFVTENTGLTIPDEWAHYELESGHSIIALANQRQWFALFIFRDQLRDGALDLIDQLKQSGRKLSLLSGDRETAVKQVANHVGIADYRFEMTPQQKMEWVKQLQSNGEKVLMIGDGVNDAPVLASADVSVALADATSLAKTSADIVLLSNRLDRIQRLLQVAARTQNIIRQNISWALLYNATAIPAAAMGLISPWLAAIGMSSSSLIVVLNALRLTR